MIKKGIVVQFNENHKWCGCLGIVTEVKKYKDRKVRYMVGVPMPENGTAFIFVTDTESAIEAIGIAAYVLREDGEQE